MVVNENNEKIIELQNIENKISVLMSQRHQFQIQEQEIASALLYLEGSKTVYKMIANIMVLTTEEKMKKELEEKQELLKIRIKSIDKQEKSCREQIATLQKEIIE